MLLIAIAAWLVGFAIWISMVLDGTTTTVSWRVYEAAGLHWRHSEPLYETRTIEGFQYFPQSAMLISPFTWLGHALGGVAWRATWWTLYAVGLWRMMRRIAPAHAWLGFPLVTAFTIMLASGPLGNGQANLAVGALLLHATAELADQRWWRATAVLGFGVALKPLMAVPLLLAWALHRPLRWRIAVALLVVAAAPWLVKDYHYVATQFTTCLAKLRLATRPRELYEDLRGLLATAGWLMPHSIYLVVRAVAAVGTLLLCARARRLREPFACVALAAYAAGYLMLFNPRTQSTSYAIVAGPAALLAAAHLLDRRWAAAVPLVVILTAWSINYHLVHAIEYWLKPLGCLGFVGLLAHTIERPPVSWLRTTT